jgi:hypothetical protein
LILKQYYANVNILFSATMSIVTTPKSVEQLQAQVAGFTAEQIPQIHDRNYVIGNIGTISQTDPEDIRRITTSTEYPHDEAGRKLLSNKIPAGTEILVADRPTYIEYLRTNQGMQHELIKQRITLLQNYAKLQPQVEALASETASQESRSDHKSFVSSGSNSAVFLFEHEDKTYTLRMPRKLKNAQSSTSVEESIDNYLLGLGCPHLEQIVGASYDNGRIITEAMPGKDLSRQDANEVAEYVTDEQAYILTEAVKAASDRQIGLDTSKASNYLYDKNAGFSLIDYAHSKLDKKALVFANVSGTLTNLFNMGIYPVIGSKPEDFAVISNQLAAGMTVAKKYISAVEAVFGQEAYAQELLAELQADYATHVQTLVNLTDPAWIDEYLTYEKSRRKKIVDILDDDLSDNFLS